ncbi:MULTISPECIES: hypothetical protein [Dyella]|uniref:Uncharacterized protein n=2 Tax=Dyella TaxID=231454 RepID=A0A4V2NKU8_9GAMM|nr:MULTISPECIES: hypothetical protein [Dyella]TBR36169.1 hypothetical protein EYV96_16375 [Dyella terrae]TCI06218.1 hypothetical protein EZM97_35465 [Dyella soli]
MDTLDLLEAIGSDASLRHATAEELNDLLAEAQASEALTAAVATGDRAHLAAEFGQKGNNTPQVTQTPGHEEEAEEPLEAPAPDDDKSLA